MEIDRKIETTLPLSLLIKPLDRLDQDWVPFEQGPGIFLIPHNHVAMVEIHNLHDDLVSTLVEEIADCTVLYELNLSENRNVGNEGMRWIKNMIYISRLNLSACGVNDRGLDLIIPMRNITFLDLSYCTRITDIGIKKLDKMRSLEELSIRGIPRITHAAVKKIERRDLTIRR
jgi:hypothetical protein